MNARESLVYTKGNWQMKENHGTLEDISITNKEDSRFESPQITDISAYQNKHYFQLQQSTETSRSRLVKNESESELSEEWRLGYNVDDTHVGNGNGKKITDLKPKLDIRLPLKSFKLDEELNHSTLNIIPKLKVESEAKLEPDLSTNFETISYSEVNTSIGEKDPLADVKEPYSNSASPGSTYSELSFQTGSTTSTSHELKNRDLNRIVVLERLYSPVIDSVQTKDSIKTTREGDDQHFQNKSRSIVRPIGRALCHENKSDLNYAEVNASTCEKSNKSCLSIISEFSFQSGQQADSNGNHDTLLVAGEERTVSSNEKKSSAGESRETNENNTCSLSYMNCEMFSPQDDLKQQPLCQESSVNNHFRSPRSLQLYTCAECGKSFNGRCNLKRHFISHTRKNVYTCRQCDNSFSTQSRLKKHLRTHSNMELYSCENCGRSYSQKRSLSIHLLTHAGLKLHTCKMCGRSYSQKSSLNRHVKAHTNIELYTCAECGKCFGEKSNLSTHMLTHTGLRLYSCEECGRSFSQKGNLIKHLTTHTGIKLFKCGKCDKSFAENSSLKKHLVTHTALKLNMCGECGKSFRLKSTLRTHFITHTGMKLYTCGKCGKSFGHKSSLNAHLVTHTRGKLYPCKECGKSFSRKNHLNTHLTTHTGIKLYTCEECGKSYSTKSNLRYHLKTHLDK